MAPAGLASRSRIPLALSADSRDADVALAAAELKANRAHAALATDDYEVAVTDERIRGGDLGRGDLASCEAELGRFGYQAAARRQPPD
jgi:hypothetical protein